MQKNIKTKILIVSIVLLTILCIITGYYAFSLREKYYINSTNNYTEAFSNLVNYVNNVENYLAKAMISKDSSHAAQTLTHIWRDSGLATVYLSRMPIQNNGLAQTEKFLNQVSDYSFSLSRKNIEGENLTEEDFKNLKELHNYSMNLKGTLNQLSEDLYNGEIDWTNLSSISNMNLAQAVDNINEFSNIDSNLNEFEGLIYDGAYSDHVNKKDKVGLTGMEIGEGEAKEMIKDFFGEEQIEKITSNGFLENAEIPSYDFSVKLKDKNDPAHQIHKTVYKPWGYYTVMQKGEGFLTKCIVVNAKAKLSLQKHFYRSKFSFLFSKFIYTYKGSVFHINSILLLIGSIVLQKFFLQIFFFKRIPV